jgi:hypothetical protein
MQTLFSTRLRSEALNAGWLKAVRKCHVSWSDALITKPIHTSKSSTYVVRPKRSWRTRLHSGWPSLRTLSRMSYSKEWKVVAVQTCYNYRSFGLWGVGAWGKLRTASARPSGVPAQIRTQHSPRALQFCRRWCQSALDDEW